MAITYYYPCNRVDTQHTKLPFFHRVYQQSSSVREFHNGQSPSNLMLSNLFEWFHKCHGHTRSCRETDHQKKTIIHQKEVAESFVQLCTAQFCKKWVHHDCRHCRWHFLGIAGSHGSQLTLCMVAASNNGDLPRLAATQQPAATYSTHLQASLLVVIMNGCN